MNINTLIAYFEKFTKLRILKLKPGDGLETNRSGYQKRYINFHIKKGEKVLDIGSGGYPFPLATHIADLYPKVTTHKTEELIKDKRPFIVCDAHNLPFKNKEFDFIYCSHLLEHVDDPASVCEELMRVGKRGYIETPTKTSDIMFNFLKLKGHHKWFVVSASNSLIFFEYNFAERKDTGSSYFYNEFHSEYSNPFQRLVKNNRQLFDNMFLWDTKFYYYVFDKTGVLTKTNKK